MTKNVGESKALAPFPVKGMFFYEWAEHAQGSVSDVDVVRGVVRLEWPNENPQKEPTRNEWSIKEWRKRVVVTS